MDQMHAIMALSLRITLDAAPRGQEALMPLSTNGQGTQSLSGKPSLTWRSQYYSNLVYFVSTYTECRIHEARDALLLVDGF